MEDKEFDEIMRSYVASTAKGEEHDLAKLKAQSPARKRRRTRVGISAVAAAIVVAVTLSVCIPLALNENDETKYGYGDSEGITYQVLLDNIDELAEDYGLSVVLPGAPMELETKVEVVFDRADDTFLGAQIFCLPKEWAFDNITCYASHDGKMFPLIANYVNYGLVGFDWHGLSAQYKLDVNEYETVDINNNPIMLEVHSYWLLFDYEGVSYYLKFNLLPDNATQNFHLPESEEAAAVYLLDFLYPDLAAELVGEAVAA